MVASSANYSRLANKLLLLQRSKEAQKHVMSKYIGLKQQPPKAWVTTTTTFNIGKKKKPPSLKEMAKSCAQVDVIVIGAGLSGLTAARVVRKHGLEVAILEANNRVGGRTHTVTGKDYGWADLGASYVGSNQKHIMKLIEELDCKTIECFTEKDRVHYSKGRQFRYKSDWPSFGIFNLVTTLDVKRMVNRMDKMSQEIPVDSPWDAPHAEEWDRITVREFLVKNCWTKDAVEFLGSLCSANSTAKDHEMSLLFYLWHLRQGNGISSQWPTKEGAMDMRVEGGAQQLCLKIAKQLEGRVHLGDPAVGVQHSNDGVIIHTLRGRTYKAQYAILAVPPPMQLKMHFDPPLSPMRTSLLQRIPMGFALKCMVFYKEPFWIDKGYNGFVSCNDGIEIVSHVTEDIKPGVKLAGVVCFVFSEKALELSEMEPEERKKAVCMSLSKFYKCEDALEPVHYVDKLWSQEQYIGGSYTCYYPPGALSQYGPALRAPIGSRVYLAGTETALEWTGYMAGAVEAGQRAATKMLQDAGKITLEGGTDDEEEEEEEQEGREQEEGKEKEEEAKPPSEKQSAFQRSSLAMPLLDFVRPNVVNLTILATVSLAFATTFLADPSDPLDLDDSLLLLSL